jgi:hypothetical protein
MFPYRSATMTWAVPVLPPTGRSTLGAKTRLSIGSESFACKGFAGTLTVNELTRIIH